jgi:hypothetical protein
MLSIRQTARRGATGGAQLNAIGMSYKVVKKADESFLL